MGILILRVLQEGTLPLPDMSALALGHCIMLQLRISLYQHFYIDLKSSNLRKILQREQDSTNWQFDKELDATDKSLSEEELLPLTEMDHLSGSQTIPYYQFINERLLEMAKSEIILELIDIDKDTNDDYNKYQNRKFNRKNTFVTYLTNNIMTKSSAQVSFCYVYMFILQYNQLVNYFLLNQKHVHCVGTILLCHSIIILCSFVCTYT